MRVDREVPLVGDIYARSAGVQDGIPTIYPPASRCATNRTSTEKAGGAAKALDAAAGVAASKVLPLTETMV